MFGETYTVITTSIILFAIMYRLFIHPINKRCEMAFHRLLGKEIARRLYQKTHPNFTYDNEYKPDNRQEQITLASAIEEFEHISQKNIQ